MAVHPNVPAPDDSKFAVTWRRIRVVLFALVMPELILLWAIRQWLVARRVHQLVKDRTKDGIGNYCILLQMMYFAYILFLKNANGR